MNELDLKEILHIFNERLVELETSIKREFGYSKKYISQLKFIEQVLDSIKEEE
jgi:hypothetical protein